MATPSIDFLTERLLLSDQLLAGRSALLEPQNLPGRYGEAVRAVDHVLKALNCEAVLAGGWAVWFHGYVGRVTQDIDIVLPAGRVDEFLKTAACSGFEVLSRPEGLWPKLRHKDTDLHVDILPQGARPGTASKPAPTTIPPPSRLGAKAGWLRYLPLPALIELKLAAGRTRDEADIVELIRANPNELESVRGHLASVHPAYLETFNQLADKAREQQDA